MPVPAGGDEFEEIPQQPYRPVRAYWVGSRFSVDWTLLDEDQEPATGVAVVGTVTLPSGVTMPMTVTSIGNVYTGRYVPTVPGAHAWRLSVSGVDDAIEGTFVVARSRVGLPPIELDPATPIGMVRLLITDVNEHEPLFEDGQLAALLAAEGDKAKLAAASALEVIARSELLIAKKISTQDLSTDGPAVASELRAQATSLREQAAAEQGGTGPGGGQPLMPVWAFPAPIPWGDDYL
ncbi:hypothetical protein [Micromonospora sp. WMMD737]|uniref:hypothetical protein n=1 Tax=Micromonospora sp. WMMD737 TaxID=3404113 RepID=UPI003B95091C